ncbi:uncharacterized protein B0T23DRAFT_382055 [Neurospora hispaniola]|uniref:Uncharacterized protein n=1 Tax=Neurospora hispaniola TaxID=588809 RepID=A0AAJ0MQ70_9PEZI|nr:hypothetical protein B0T23DRAFT_382055 [Neurospora hispaniola]
MFLLGNVHDRFSRLIPAAQKNSWGQRRHLEWLHSVYKDAQFPSLKLAHLSFSPSSQLLKPSALSHLFKPPHTLKYI